MVPVTVQWSSGGNGNRRRPLHRTRGGVCSGSTHTSPCKGWKRVATWKPLNSLAFPFPKRPGNAWQLATGFPSFNGLEAGFLAIAKWQRGNWQRKTPPPILESKGWKRLATEHRCRSIPGPPSARHILFGQGSWARCHDGYSHSPASSAPWTNSPTPRAKGPVGSSSHLSSFEPDAMPLTSTGGRALSRFLNQVL